MKIDILCSSSDHPICAYLKQWSDLLSKKHNIRVIFKKTELRQGDILFLVSCSELINSNERKLYKKSLVIHASDLPIGRGWSPHIWQILEGKKEITISLLEAEDKVDTGSIWHKITVNIPYHFLYNEINEALFAAEIKLMSFAVENFEIINPKKQNEKIDPTYYKKRTPSDSEIDINKNIKEQFDTIRVSDPTRYPSFFYYQGYKYRLTIEKVDDE